jgi:uncharacterized cofD-like protein
MSKIVVIGGGTGTFTVLRGLKAYHHDITAVVTMFDSGGSSGVLRDEHGVLPPGDVRRCLVALSSGEQEKTLRKLFNYRFEKGASLKGHSFGNILITALTEIFGREDVAINEAGAILNIKGKVLPVSLEKSQLCVELEDGSVIKGETYIDIPQHDGSLHIKKAFLEPSVNAYEEVVRAIEEADVVVLGPGDLYTSVIPNLLADGVSGALQKSKAKKVYVLNLFTKWGETNGYKASDFAKEILRYSGLKKLDYIVCNDDTHPDGILKKYAEEQKFPIEIDAGVEEFAEEVIRKPLASADSFLRHNSKALAEALNELA